MLEGTYKAGDKMFKFEKYFTDEVIEQMRKKQVCLYGMNDFAIAASQWLTKKGILIQPEEQCENPFFVIADFKESSASKQEKKCREKYPDAPIIKMVNPVEIRIEISGKCNLRCMSCQVGNHNPEVFCHKGRGFMPPDRFVKILDKTEEEYPDLVSIFFFIVGEPFLHPHIKELLRITKDRGLLTVISSNFSLKIPWDKELLSLIDVLKISVSGFYQDVYETTHNGGNVELVKANMHQVAELIRAYEIPTKVFVGYHAYTNNKGRDYDAMENLCQELEFDFCPVDALYFNLFYRSGDDAFPEEARKFIESYYPEPEKILTPTLADEKELQKPCRNRRDKLFIDWDGSVMLCEILHKDAFFNNYSDVSREEIEEWRNNHSICQLCRQYGLDYK